jgi:hypothetical protein
MDKQQATEHILKRLQAGYYQEEIADELSRLLKAPVELTGKFVQQVAASHPEAVPTLPLPPPEIDEVDERPEWLKSMAEQPSRVADNDLPPSLRELLEDEYQPAETGVKVSPFLPEPEPENNAYSPEPESIPEQAEPITLTEEREEHLSENSLQRDVNREALTALVMKQLSSHKRHSDVVAEICHHTGWEWNKAQRFVARVQTEHQDELTKKQNRMLIPIGIAFMIGGIFLVFYTGAAVLRWVVFFTGRENLIPDLPTVSMEGIPQTIALFLTGLALISGSVIGILRAIMDRN